MLLSLVRKAARSRILGNAGVMAGGMGLRLLLQVGYFALVARALGTAAFGEFASIVAIAVMTSAFAGWGGDQLLIRSVARDPEAFRRAFGNALAYLVASGPAAGAVAIAIALAGHSSSFALVLLIVLSDVVFARVNVVAAACFQAFELAGRTAALNIALSAARLLAVLLWIALPVERSAESWAWFYAASSGVVAAGSLVAVIAALGRPVWCFERGLWVEGFHFSAQLASFSAFRDVDKPILANLGSLEAAGIYAAAFRVVDASLVPIRSLMFAAYVRFFQHGAAGARGSLGFARRLLPIGVALGIATGIALAIVAPALPSIIGHAYAGTERIVWILAILPFLYAFYYIGADTLVSSGHIGTRTTIQLVVLALQVALCFWLAPRFGAIGVACASVAVHVVLAALSWIAAIRYAKRA